MVTEYQFDHGEKQYGKGKGKGSLAGRTHDTRTLTQRNENLDHHFFRSSLQHCTCNCSSCPVVNVSESQTCIHCSFLRLLQMSRCPQAQRPCRSCLNCLWLSHDQVPPLECFVVVVLFLSPGACFLSSPSSSPDPRSRVGHHGRFQSFDLTVRASFVITFIVHHDF